MKPHTNIFAHKIEMQKEEGMAVLGLYDLMKTLLAEAKEAPDLAGGVPSVGFLNDPDGWILSLCLFVDGQPAKPIFAVRADSPQELLGKILHCRAESTRQAGKPSNN
ncbi:hypothetical protein H5P28_00195 [Ruficoccus amylovorans]|uniref:Uncharacterized protein n=1 Tax=Ruficoccus amylovorans TaxID=1804625 RepID=A0A842HB59_9BACT|nr:hypothetical protein [Ruficoccus amylovorans]MBC2592671.1 hypothetical protein [Ruficoccus amylovorans]